jgi:hypothetical protein
MYTQLYVQCMMHRVACSGGSRIFPKSMPNEKKSHVFQINPFINLVNIIIKFTTQFDI